MINLSNITVTQIFQKTNLRLCCKQKQQEYNHLLTECELNIATTLSHTTSISSKTNTKEQISRAQSFLIKSTFLRNIQIIFKQIKKQDSMHGENKQTSVHIQ